MVSTEKIYLSRYKIRLHYSGTNKNYNNYFFYLKIWIKTEFNDGGIKIAQHRIIYSRLIKIPKNLRQKIEYIL